MMGLKWSKKLKGFFTPRLTTPTKVLTHPVKSEKIQICIPGKALEITRISNVIEKS